MDKVGDDHSTRLRESFLDGYREAAVAVESVGAKALVRPVHTIGCILEEANTAHAHIRQTLEACRQAAEGIKSLPEEEQEVARVELQQNLRHLLACCETVSDHVRASSHPEETELEKEEDADEKESPQTEKGKKRSYRR
jgi:hypothetical protein